MRRCRIGYIFISPARESQFPIGAGLCLPKEPHYFSRENQGEVRNE
jgi:hypothetical protein